MTNAQKPDPARIAVFLAQPRTAAEIAKELGVPGMTEQTVRDLTLPTGTSVFEQKNALGVSAFAAVAQAVGKKFKDRNWSIWQCPNGDPYIWIQFLDVSGLRRIKIVPISDVHYGSRAHNRKRFAEYLKWIEREKDVFAFLNGDIIENAIDGSIGGAVYESIMTPDEQIFGTHDKKEPGMIELLRPVAHKILWAQPGNHEWRTWKKTNLDPLKFICSALDIPYFDEPIFADVLAWGHRFTFYSQHGTSGSNTKGGKMIAATRPSQFQEAIDFLIMGHVHDSMANATVRIVRERIFGPDGRIVSIQLKERPQYTVIAPSFHGYFGSYGSRAGYAPGSWGSVSCTLFKDGKYRVSE